MADDTEDQVKEPDTGAAGNEPNQPTGDSGQKPPWERDGEEFSPEKAWKLIENLRADNTKLKESNDSSSAKLREIEDAKLTEQEKLQRDLKEAQEQLADVNRAKAWAEARAKYPQLTEQDFDLIGAATPEEITDKAAKLAARLDARRVEDGLRPHQPAAAGRPDRGHGSDFEEDGRLDALGAGQIAASTHQRRHDMADNFSSQILRGDLGGALIPDEISQEIIQTLPQSSVLLTRARRVPMSSKKKTQPVLASLPEAYWVSEGGLKQTSKTGWEDVQITAEELAVIVPIPDSVVDDAKINLWDTVKPLIAEAMGKKIDQAGIFGVDKPSTWGNDILAGATAAGTNVASGTGVDLADDIAMIGQKLSEKGFAVNGFASQPGLNWQLARLRDANGQPIYTPSVAAGNPASLYGYPLNEVANGAWDTTKAMLLAADWTKFVVGVRQDITYKVFDQGVISDTAGNVVYNLMQQDAQAMRVVMRVGFAVANPLTRIAAKGSQYPAGFLTPAASRKADK